MQAPRDYATKFLATQQLVNRPRSLLLLGQTTQSNLSNFTENTTPIMQAKWIKLFHCNPKKNLVSNFLFV